jgi:hypothetical protein
MFLLKPVCVVTFRIPFFKDSYFQAFDLVEYVIFVFVKLILRKAGDQHLHKRKLKISCFCEL